MLIRTYQRRQRYGGRSSQSDDGSQDSFWNSQDSHLFGAYSSQESLAEDLDLSQPSRYSSEHDLSAFHFSQTDEEESGPLDQDTGEDNMGARLDAHLNVSNSRKHSAPSSPSRSLSRKRIFDPETGSQKSLKMQSLFYNANVDNGAALGGAIVRHKKGESKMTNGLGKGCRAGRTSKQKGGSGLVFAEVPGASPSASLMEAQESGEMIEHVDEANFAMDGLKKGQPLRVLRASMTTMAQLCKSADRRRLLKTHGLARPLVEAVVSLPMDDPPLTLAAAAVLFFLASDGHDEDLFDSTKLIQFLLRLLESSDGILAKKGSKVGGNRLLAFGESVSDKLGGTVVKSIRALFQLDRKSEEGNAERDKEGGAQGKGEIADLSSQYGVVMGEEVTPSWLALLTLESSCSSAIVLDDVNGGTGGLKVGRFKERLREEGGLDSVCELASLCIVRLQELLQVPAEVFLEGGEGSNGKRKREDGREELAMLLRCLRLLEHMTFLSETNKKYLLELSVKQESDGELRRAFVTLLLTSIEALSGLDANWSKISGKRQKNNVSEGERTCLTSVVEKGSQIPLVPVNPISSDHISNCNNFSSEGGEFSFGNDVLETFGKGTECALFQDSNEDGSYDSLTLMDSQMEEEDIGGSSQEYSVRVYERRKDSGKRRREGAGGASGGVESKSEKIHVRKRAVGGSVSTGLGTECKEETDDSQEGENIKREHRLHTSRGRPPLPPRPELSVWGNSTSVAKGKLPVEQKSFSFLNSHQISGSKRGELNKQGNFHNDGDNAIRSESVEALDPYSFDEFDFETDIAKMDSSNSIKVRAPLKLGLELSAEMHTRIAVGGQTVISKNSVRLSTSANSFKRRKNSVTLKENEDPFGFDVEIERGKRHNSQAVEQDSKNIKSKGFEGKEMMEEQQALHRLLIGDCLVSAVKVIMNLTNEHAIGCRQVAASGALQIMSDLAVLKCPQICNFAMEKEKEKEKEKEEEREREMEREREESENWARKMDCGVAQEESQEEMVFEQEKEGEGELPGTFATKGEREVEIRETDRGERQEQGPEVTLEKVKTGEGELPPEDVDVLMVVLGVLVNLVEKDDSNRAHLASLECTVSQVTCNGEKTEGRVSVLSFLCCLFLSKQGNHGTARGGEKLELTNMDEDEEIEAGQREAEAMMVEAYAALLLAFLSQQSEKARNSIGRLLPGGNLSSLVPVLEHFIGFHESLQTITPESYLAVQTLISACKASPQP